MLRQYELVERVQAYNPTADEALLNRAYVFTVQKHGKQKRASGDPYFSHPIEVAGILTDLNLDVDTIVTALLHDTIEDTLTSAEEIEQLFGANIAALVAGVTKLSRIEAQSETERAVKNLRKFLLAMSDDIRVLLVKLADRLHNMRTLHFISSPEKRRRIAKETMDIYAPLAERIGLYEYMREMQMLAFKELQPEAYTMITERLAGLTLAGTGKIDDIVKQFEELLSEANIVAKISGREKHPYSIWNKMKERHVNFEQIADIFAYRIITEDVEQCYQALGVIHRRWKMVPGLFKDYISTPKRNGYRSLHTTIMHHDNMRLEVQIRSEDMHRQSEFGLAAHWAYKDKGSIPDGQAGWIRDLIEIIDQTQDADELLEHTRIAMYQDRIFAFSPKGAVYQLPKGATPIDFAYAVHTELGDRNVGAKINGRAAPLRTPLANGDTVEILVSENQTPQAKWLGYAASGKARAAIRRHLRSQERKEAIVHGRTVYRNIVSQRLGEFGKKIGAVAQKTVLRRLLRRLEVPDEDALYWGLGKRNITSARLTEALDAGLDIEANGEGSTARGRKQRETGAARETQGTRGKARGGAQEGARGGTQGETQGAGEPMLNGQATEATRTVSAGGAGSTASAGGTASAATSAATSAIEDLPDGASYRLAECCHPLVGDRIVGLAEGKQAKKKKRKKDSDSDHRGSSIVVHMLDCPQLADTHDSEWIDLRWREGHSGGQGVLAVTIANEVGTLSEMTGIIASNKANIDDIGPMISENDFHSYRLVVAVRDVHHLMHILSSLRASDAIVRADRL